MKKILLVLTILLMGNKCQDELNGIRSYFGNHENQSIEYRLNGEVVEEILTSDEKFSDMVCVTRENYTKIVDYILACKPQEEKKDERAKSVK